MSCLATIYFFPFQTNVLGRAQDIGEFIRIGCHEAELEIELLNALDPTKNYSVKRVIRK